MLTDPEEDYARGYVPFLGCTIYLDSRPLIPRTETEFWAEKAIAALSPTVLGYEDAGGDGMLRCLDLFAGSGAIGIAVLKHVPHAKVDFGDINESHFPTILKSIAANGIEQARARFLKTDVWSGIDRDYDQIFANPPYIAPNSGSVDESVVRHEPKEALYAEENGFALIRQTIEGARRHLTPRGELYLEHDPEQAALIAAAAPPSGLVAGSYADQYGVLRYSILRPRHMA